MQKTIVEIIHIELFGNFTFLENPNFKYDKVYGQSVSGFPIYKLDIGGALMSRRHDYSVTVPMRSLDNHPAFIWFENATRSYWR